MAAEKLYYSMGEVAEMLDVNPSLIRFWEQKFDVIKPRKNKKGNRMFTPSDVQNLKTIYHLVKERGMTLAGAQKYMKASRGNIGRDMEIAERLQTIRSLLLEVRQQLGADGPVVDEVPEDMEPRLAKAASALETEAADDIAASPAAEVIEVTPEVVQDIVGSQEAIEDIAEEATEEEQDDTAFEQIVEEMNGEPEVMLDFEPVLFEPETAKDAVEEEKKEEPQRPLYIEQTLF